MRTRLIKLLRRRIRDSDKRVESPSLLLDDLKGLGMFGELSDDQRYARHYAVSRRTPSGNDYANGRGHFE